ncbi:MAG: ArgE/DapE family deacylase [Wenzhouxiangellaceae bacterium]
MISDLEARALAAVDIDGLVETLCDLIRFESDQGREVAVQQHLAGMLEGMGMTTDVWEVGLDDVRRHPAYGAEIERERAIGVLGSWGSGHGRSLILNGHVDVVPPGEPDRWTVPPWRGTIRDGRVYGRGAVDMKGGLCCAIYAVRALMEAGVRLHGRVMIQPVAGEEDGGVGTLAAMLRGHTADAAIVLEPTEMAIAPAQGGALSFRITIPGLAAHGALRSEGVDPMEYFALIHQTLRDLEARRNRRLAHPLFSDYEIPFAICVGKVRAGIWASTVAESLVLEGRYGVGIDEDCDLARQELEQAIFDAAAGGDEWLRDNPPVVEWWGARYMPAAISPDHPVVESLSGAFQAATGSEAAIRGMPYGADMHLLVHQGNTPAVLFGPGDVRTAHAPDEFVPIPDLEAVTRALVLTIMRFCGSGQETRTGAVGQSR